MPINRLKDRKFCLFLMSILKYNLCKIKCKKKSGFGINRPLGSSLDNLSHKLKNAHFKSVIFAGFCYVKHFICECSVHKKRESNENCKKFPLFHVFFLSNAN